MTPYAALKTAISRRDRICTPWEVRHELDAYLKQFKVIPKTPEGRVIDWNDLYTRSEWFATVNKGKKSRTKRKKDGSVLYQNIEENEVSVHKDPLIDQMNKGWAKEVDTFTERLDQQEAENGYNADW